MENNKQVKTSAQQWSPEKDKRVTRWGEMRALNTAMKDEDICMFTFRTLPPSLPPDFFEFHYYYFYIIWVIKHILFTTGSPIHSEYKWITCSVSVLIFYQRLLSWILPLG